MAKRKEKKTASEKYKIEKNIPIGDHYKDEYKKYPLGEMEPMDSFFVSVGDKEKGSEVVRVRSAVSVYGRRNGKKFSCRMVEGGVRIWRTS